MTKRKRTRRVYTKARHAGRRGMRILGTTGIKGMLTGGAMLFAANALLPNVGGEFAGPLKMVAAGMGAKAIGVSGAQLAGAGLMQAGATLLAKFLGGGLAIPGFGGGGGNGGTDY